MYEPESILENPGSVIIMISIHYIYHMKAMFCAERPVVTCYLTHWQCSTAVSGNCIAQRKSLHGPPRESAPITAAKFPVCQVYLADNESCALTSILYCLEYWKMVDS